MRLYVVRGDLAFSMLQPVPEGAWPVRSGTPVTERWRTVDLEPLDGGDAEFIPVDCFSLNTTSDGLILSEAARLRLEGLLSPVGEFWPVRVLGRPYWWFNCLAVCDVLDRSATEADWGTVSGGWGSFRWITSTRRLAFHEESLGSAPPIFRVPEYPQGVLFGREGVEALSRIAELTGFQFDLIWSVADGGVEDPPGIGFGGAFGRVSSRDTARKRAGAQRTLERRAKLG